MNVSKYTCREPNEEDQVHDKESTNFPKNHLTKIKECESVSYKHKVAKKPELWGLVYTTMRH